jgi:hypothetical protein
VPDDRRSIIVIDLICDLVDQGTTAGACRARDPAVASRIAYHGIDVLPDDRISDGKPIDMDDLTAYSVQRLRPLGDADHRSVAPRRAAATRTTGKRFKQ